MKRYPLKRKKPLAPKKRKPRRSSRIRDKAYMERVRQLPCAAVGLEVDCGLFEGATHHCFGEVEAHHAGRGRGLSQKASDDTTIPLCRGAHYAWHISAGVFFGWGRTRRREWADEQIKRTQSALGYTKESR